MTRQYTVPSMSCQHCVNAITGEVSAVDGVRQVRIDLGSKRVTVDADERVTDDIIVEAIHEAGYDEVTVAS